MAETLQAINVWVGRGAQMSDDEQTTCSPTREASCKVNEEEKIIQDLWSDININNSWEMLLLKSPESIKALGELMVLSLTHSKRASVNIGGVSLRSLKDEVDSGYLQTLLVQAVNEGRIAQELSHQSMSAIAHNMNEIPQSIRKILELLSQHSTEEIQLELPVQMNRIQVIVKDSIEEANSLEPRFQKALRLMSDRSGGIGRTGFSLLADVKTFWADVTLFCKEISKLIQYTLDSSTNAFVANLLTQFRVASKQNKFNIKQSARDEIYQSSLAIIAYALSVRHLANAYILYSNQFIMPQINIIARYPMLATNEIEFTKAQRQFNEYNAACKHETDRIIGVNSKENNRRSILELDMGLNLHINDIGSDLDVILPPVAQFRKKNRTTSKAKELQKDGQRNTKELDEEEQNHSKAEESRKIGEEANRVKDEGKRTKEEKNRLKEEEKKEKEEKERKRKEEKKRAKEEQQGSNLERSNSERKKFWRRSWPRSTQSTQSPQSPQSLQFDVSLQTPPHLQQYYPEPQPQSDSFNIQPHSSSEQSKNIHLSQQNSPTTQSQSGYSQPSIVQLAYTPSPTHQKLQFYPSDKQLKESFHPLSPKEQLPIEPSALSAHTPESTQFHMSPQTPPSNQSHLPQQYFQYPPQNTSHHGFEQRNIHTHFSEISQYIEDGQFSPQPAEQTSILLSQTQIAPAIQSQNTQEIIIQHTSAQNRTQLSPVPHAQHTNPPTQLLNTQYQAHNKQQDYIRNLPQPLQSSTPLQPLLRQEVKQKPLRERPISYPSNFRKAEYYYPDHTYEYPFYRSREIEETAYSDQFPDFSRSPKNPISPQSPLAAQSLPSHPPSGYYSLQHGQHRQDPSAQLQTNERGGFFGRLRASFSRKSKQTTTADKEDEENMTKKQPL